MRFPGRPGSFRILALHVFAIAGLAGALAAPAWRDYASKSDDWYRSDDGRRITENILSWQSPLGSWPKNLDTTAKPFAGDAKTTQGTFDNGATIGELRFLARAFRATEENRYQEAFLKGVDHIFEAQYPTGGWPQTFPPGNQYQRHITFNDDAMVRLMEFLGEVATSADYEFIDSARRETAQAKFDRGIQCILRCQIVVNYPDNEPTRGWGQFIQGFFNDSVRVINLAKSGRSTKTFIDEGLWQKALNEKPNVVLIQFGHNDSHGPGRPESTDAATSYREYLRRYIDDARATGATPLLVTPMCRRMFNPDGRLEDALGPYAKAMKDVAVEKHAGVIDLHSTSAELFQKLGDAGSAELANKTGDRTHFNEKGARAMAELVMKELPAVEQSLRPFLK